MRGRPILCCILVVLSGCAADYVPSADPSAAKVRVRFDCQGHLSLLTTHVRPMSGSTCGPKAAVPNLWPWRGEPIPPLYTAAGPQAEAATPVFPRFPRAAMVGSEDPLRHDQAELLLAPGVYRFEFQASAGSVNCPVSVSLELEAGRQYEVGVDMFMARGVPSCQVTARRHDGAGWQPLAPVKPASCAG